MMPTPLPISSIISRTPPSWRLDGLRPLADPEGASPLPASAMAACGEDGSSERAKRRTAAHGAKTSQASFFASAAALLLLALFLIPSAHSSALRVLPFVAANTICEDRWYNISITDSGYGYDALDSLAGWTYAGLGADALQDCAIQPGSTQVICSAVVQDSPRTLQLFVSNDPGQSADVFSGTYYDEQANLGQPIAGGAGAFTILPDICGNDPDGDFYYAGSPPANSCGCLGGNDCLPNDPASHPNALDIPNDGIDQDCCSGDATNFITVSRILPASITASTTVRLTIAASGNCNTIEIGESFPTQVFNCNTASHGGVCNEAKGTLNWTIGSTQASEVTYTLTLVNPSLCYQFSGSYAYAGEVRGIAGSSQHGSCSCAYYGEEVCGNAIDENCDGSNAACANGCVPTNSAVDICGNAIDEDCDGSDRLCSGAFTPGCTPRNGGVEICGNAIDEDCNGADASCSPGCVPANRGVEICANGRDENCDGRDDACHPACGQGYVGEELCGNTVDENCDGVIDRCVSGNYPANTLLPLGQVCSGFSDFGFCQGREICGNGIDEDCDGIAESCLDSSCTISDSGFGTGCEQCGNAIDEDCDGFENSCVNCLMEVDSEVCGNILDEDCDGVANACMPCYLTSVSVTPNCAAGSKFGCEQGETLTIDAAYSGGCPAVSIIQVDAATQNSVCTLSQNGAASGGIDGAAVTCTSSPCSALWAFPTIPAACQNKRMDAGYALLYKDALGGLQASSLPDAAGSFDIGEPCYDDDGDTYGQPGKSAGCFGSGADCCDLGTESAVTGCSLANRNLINPGAAETTANAGVDNDCNPSTDVDNDGYTNDCNDNIAAINPGSPDTIANPGTDNDCNPSTDTDNDGYTAANGDCNDFNPSINPGAADNSCDSIDQNCNGVADDGIICCVSDCNPATYGNSCSGGSSITYCGNCDADACSEVCTGSCGTSPPVYVPYTAAGYCSCSYPCTGNACQSSCDPYANCPCNIGRYNCDGDWANGCESTIDCASIPCTDECTAGATQCSGIALQECRTTWDADLCAEWGTAQSCSISCGGPAITCPDPNNYCGNYQYCGTNCPVLQDECSNPAWLNDGFDNDCDAKYDDAEEHCTAPPPPPTCGPGQYLNGQTCVSCNPGEYPSGAACVQCGGINVEGTDYLCGVADSVCPASFGADCSPAVPNHCQDPDCP